MPESNDAYDILYNLMDKIQGNPKIRRFIAAILVIALIGLSGYFIYGLLPKHYTLSISGGDILGKRHYLVKVLQEEGLKNGLVLDIDPMADDNAALQAVSDGTLDLALIRSVSSRKLDNVVHVATLPAETVHLLVRPEITSLQELKGLTINTGPENTVQRDLAAGILAFGGLYPDIDYVETHASDEELMNHLPKNLPDALFNISYMPSYFVDYFVKVQGYEMIALPFAESFSYRYPWASQAEIGAGIYDVEPDVPAESLATLGVDLELIAHANTDPNAIAAFLKTLYQSSAESIIHQPINEEDGNSLTILPMSAGTEKYLNRNKSIFTMDFVDNLKNIGGSLMAFLSTVLVVVRWFKGKKKEEAAEPGE